MELSNRITNITGGGSDGWDVFLRARRMIADGTPVTELTIGEHDVLTSDAHVHYADVDARLGFSFFNGSFDSKDGFVDVGYDTPDYTIRYCFPHSQYLKFAILIFAANYGANFGGPYV